MPSNFYSVTKYPMSPESDTEDQKAWWNKSKNKSRDYSWRHEALASKNSLVILIWRYSFYVKGVQFEDLLWNL